MEDLISPKYQMKIITSIEQAIWEEFKTYKQVKLYITKWHQNNYGEIYSNNNYWENFQIVEKINKDIDLTATLHNLPGTELLKIAIDLGVETPDFIPSIPTFKNELSQLIWKNNLPSSREILMFLEKIQIFLVEFDKLHPGSKRDSL